MARAVYPIRLKFLKIRMERNLMIRLISIKFMTFYSQNRILNSHSIERHMREFFPFLFVTRNVIWLIAT